MAKRKTKAERAIEAELQLEAVALQPYEDALKQHDEEHLNSADDNTAHDVEEKPLHVEDKKVQHTYTRRLRKL